MIWYDYSCKKSGAVPMLRKKSSVFRMGSYGEVDEIKPSNPGL